MKEQLHALTELAENFVPRRKIRKCLNRLAERAEQKMNSLDSRAKDNVRTALRMANKISDIIYG